MARRKKKTHATYGLRCTRDQVIILERSLEMFARLGMGHLRPVGELLYDLHPRMFGGNIRIMHSLLRTVQDIVLYDLATPFGAGHRGIGDPAVHPAAKVAYDLQKIIQNVVAEAEDMPVASLWRDQPLHLGSEPLAHCERTCESSSPAVEV